MVKHKSTFDYLMTISFLLKHLRQTNTKMQQFEFENLDKEVKNVEMRI